MLSRKVVLALLAVASLVSAGIAYSAIGERTLLQQFPTAHVYGGGELGPGTFSNGNFTIARPRDLSVDAHRIGPVVKGHVYYGVNETGVLMLGGDVKCLAVSGNRAAVGGVIRESTDPASIGYGFVIFLTDNGSPASPTRDRSSAALVDPLSASGWPAGFPRVCPAPDGPFNAVGWLDVHSGDVVVQGG
jgi:hypothetical protein